VSGAAGRSAEVLRARGGVGVEVGTASRVWQSHIYIRMFAVWPKQKGLPSLIYHEPVLEVRFMRGAAGTTRILTIRGFHEQSWSPGGVALGRDLHGSDASSSAILPANASARLPERARLNPCRFSRLEIHFERSASVAATNARIRSSLRSGVPFNSGALPPISSATEWNVWSGSVISSI
jgi:hypothetical protein